MQDVKFSPDGSLLASVAGTDLATMIPLLRSTSGEVRVWRVATGENIKTIPLARPATRVAFSPDGKSIAVGCDDGTIKVWDASSWDRPERPAGARP